VKPRACAIRVPSWRPHAAIALELRASVPVGGQEGLSISSLSVHGLGFTLATALSLHIGERYTTGLSDSIRENM
jgi:hypothetical protein